MSLTLEQFNAWSKANGFSTVPGDEPNVPQQTNRFGGVRIASIDAYRARVTAAYGGQPKLKAIIDKYIPEYFIWRDMPGLTQSQIRIIEQNGNEREGMIGAWVDADDRFLTPFDWFGNLDDEHGIPSQRVKGMVCAYVSTVQVKNGKNKPYDEDEIYRLVTTDLDRRIRANQ